MLIYRLPTRHQKKIDSAQYCMLQAKKLLSDESSRKAMYSYQIGEGLLYSTDNKNEKAIVSFKIGS